jgi:hypothetical protein
MSPDNLTQEALNWALTHCERYGDTDIFPQPFEFEAIRANWQEVVGHLLQRDLGKYTSSAAQRMLVPKPGFGFRVALQLDPLDTLVYTALAYECAETLESHRIPANAGVACSYRINLTPEGSFFADSDGWSAFHSRSKELASDPSFTHVVVADLTDFYNQASHHRIENALESATVPIQRAKNIEGFLGALTAKQSRGLPVGPAASILLAEACLNDVDKHLLSKRRVHVRYVDDFRVFCRSYKEAIDVLHDLTDYLYTAHRLAFQSSKTMILRITTFCQGELQDPEETERQAKRDRLQALIEKIQEEIGYNIDLNEIEVDKLDEAELKMVLGEQNLKEAILENLRDLFEICIAQRPIRLGPARYLLRRARMLRARSLYELIFANLETLAPVFRDLALYIVATLPERRAKEYGDKLCKFLASDPIGQIPFVRIWGLSLLAQKPALASFETGLELAEGSERDLGIRPAALLARAHRQTDWVRRHKENWSNHKPWDRRAIIWASAALPKDERTKWLEMVKETADILDRSTAISAQSGIDRA